MPALYKIGVVSRRTGLSASMLRLWEDQYGLLAPSRTRGGTRLYSEADLERIRYVRHLVRDRGFALNAIADVIDDASSKIPYAFDRVAIENIYLREATNHSEIEAGRRVAQIQATVRRLVRAESGEAAAATLVAGARALTGADSSSLGLYCRKHGTMIFVVFARGERVETRPRTPLQVSDYPRAWQDAIAAREPYAESDLFRLDLALELGSMANRDGARSFHAEPLAIGQEMVGILTLANSRPGVVGPEAQQIIEQLALAAGPAIHYFAQQLE
jgi:MerR family transcriptional regulator, heat shock protein HspR